MQVLNLKLQKILFEKSEESEFFITITETETVASQVSSKMLFILFWKSRGKIHVAFFS